LIHVNAHHPRAEPFDPNHHSKAEAGNAAPPSRRARCRGDDGGWPSVKRLKRVIFWLNTSMVPGIHRTIRVMPSTIPQAARRTRSVDERTIGAPSTAPQKRLAHGKQQRKKLAFYHSGGCLRSPCRLTSPAKNPHHRFVAQCLRDATVSAADADLVVEIPSFIARLQ
jgi:hypothetical protein